ncbi:MAG TPA: hypothetical protein VHB73_07690 [Alphaproteobacteria bacterium]|nr:hypothetical protein [Alphaproteobacteria bacterium]
MRKWIVLSTLLHLLLFLLIWLGLPQMVTPPPEPAQVVPVDIADISQITAVKKAPEQKAQPTPPPKPEEPKPPEPKPAEKPPEPPKPPTSEPTPELKAPQLKTEDKPEPVPTPKPKPPKPEPPKPDPLASILKNVAKMKPTEKQPETKPAPQKEPAPAPSPPQVPATAEHLSLSEEDALRRQLAQCWNVPVGARDVQNMTVDIYISINADRTVREAVVVDQARMASDPFFRTLAESALRALYNPHCSPLALPPEKYQQWKDTVMTFNPKDMF